MAPRKGYKHPGNKKNLVPFKPGKGADRDPRIYMGGSRAKGQKELKAAIEAFLNEADKKTKQTRLDELLDLMLRSSSALDRKTLLEYGFGKLPQPVQAKFEGDVTIHFIDETEDDDSDGDASADD